MPDIELVQLPAQTLHALAAGDLAAANSSSPVPLTAYFVRAEWHSVWVRRSAQVSQDPGCAAWITRAIFDTGEHTVVGRAGFHGQPDAAGMVELGYGVDPAFRRRGYARAAVALLLEQVRDDSAVQTVRATISPGNVASRALVAQYGFVEVGEQSDAEDGLELVLERPARFG
jgi:RimJ/RimL family protein N-acetyltransferase